jgi:probable HAF family extracellular repeat protein
MRGTPAAALAAATVVSTTMLSGAVATPHSPARSSDRGASGVTTLVATARDLGTLGGKRSAAAAVDGGVVVGVSKRADGRTHAFFMDLAAPEPVMVDVGVRFPGAVHSAAVDIDEGVLVGSVQFTANRNQAFALDVTDPLAEPLMLGTLGGEWSFPRAIDGDLVVGESATEDGSIHAFAFPLDPADPQMVDLGTLGGSFSSAYSVHGTVVVGAASTSREGYRGFYVDLAAPEPRMVSVGSLGGGGYSYATDVHGTDLVGWGWSGAGDRALHLDLADPEPGLRDLGTLGGHRSLAWFVDRGLVGGQDRTKGVWRAVYADLAAPEPRLRKLGSLGSSSWLHELRDGVLVGDADILTGLSHAFAYDVHSRAPEMVDLGTLGGRSSGAVDVEGNLVVGESQVGGRTHATVWDLGETTAPAFEFTRLATEVDEDAGRVRVRVARRGALGRASVWYATTPSWSQRTSYSTRSVPGEDYVPVTGRLVFDRGETQKSFSVKLLNDRRSERWEYVELTLRKPSSNAVLGTPRLAALKIRPNDR